METDSTDHGPSFDLLNVNGEKKSKQFSNFKPFKFNLRFYAWRTQCKMCFYWYCRFHFNFCNVYIFFLYCFTFTFKLAFSYNGTFNELKRMQQKKNCTRGSRKHFVSNLIVKLNIEKRKYKEKYRK